MGPPMSNRSWMKWAGIGCAGLILLMMIAGAGLYFAVRSLTAGPEDVARDFCSAAAAGDYGRAHDHFSVPLKERQPLDAFTAAVKATPSLFDIVDTTFTDRSIDLSGAKLAGTVTLRAGTTVPVSFTFVRENDVWKLPAYNIGS
jgi:hypothetical protein